MRWELARNWSAASERLVSILVMSLKAVAVMGLVFLGGGSGVSYSIGHYARIAEFRVLAITTTYVKIPELSLSGREVAMVRKPTQYGLVQ